MALSHEVSSVTEVKPITALVEQSLSAAQGAQSICKVLPEQILPCFQANAQQRSLFCLVNTA